MKRSRLVAGFVGACLATAAAVPVPAEEPDPLQGLTPVEILEPGTRGTIVSTLDGNRRVEIPFSYLGTLENFSGPGYDLHLVRMEGPTAERIGAANGLSGSPAYVDGRLLGALSYRIGRLPKHPVAGITPIENMLSAARPAATVSGAERTGISPIGTPIVAAGLAEPVRRWVEVELEAMGMLLVAGGGTDTPEGDAVPLAPGSPVGVELVRGDLRMGATGTVTHVDGDRVFAFGHPFMGSGAVEMPMVTANVVHALADLSGGVLLANMGRTVGAIEQDRLTGIVGRLGGEARMIPLRLDVRGGDYGERRYDFEVIRQPELAPLLMAVSAANSLIANTGYSRKSTVRARGTVRLKDLPDLPLDMSFAGDDGRDPGIAVASELLATLGRLLGNPFAEIEVEGVELEIDATTEIASYRVESLHYDRGAIAPGESLRVTCVLRAFRGERVTHEFVLELPERLPRSGSLIVAVGDPRGIEQILGSPLEQRSQSSSDAASLVRVLGDRRSSHRLTAVVYEPGGAVVSRGVAFSELPPTAQKLLSLQSASPTARTRGLVSPLVRVEHELDGPVRGGRQLRLRVERGFDSEENG